MGSRRRRTPGEKSPKIRGWHWRVEAPPGVGKTLCYGSHAIGHVGRWIHEVVDGQGGLLSRVEGWCWTVFPGNELAIPMSVSQITLPPYRTREAAEEACLTYATDQHRSGREQEATP